MAHGPRPFRRYPAAAVATAAAGARRLRRRDAVRAAAHQPQRGAPAPDRAARPRLRRARAVAAHRRPSAGAFRAHRRGPRTVPAQLRRDRRRIDRAAARAPGRSRSRQRCCSRWARPSRRRSRRCNPATAPTAWRARWRSGWTAWATKPCPRATATNGRWKRSTASSTRWPSQHPQVCKFDLAYLEARQRPPHPPHGMHRPRRPRLPLPRRRRRRAAARPRARRLTPAPSPQRQCGDGRRDLLETVERETGARSALDRAVAARPGRRRPRLRADRAGAACAATGRRCASCFRMRRCAR